MIALILEKLLALIISINNKNALGMNKIKIFILKNLDYKRCTKFQYACRENLLKTNSKSYLIITTHNNVITFGKNKIKTDLLVNEAFLKKLSIDLVDTKRGGKITCHGNGQIVFYPIINIKDFSLKTKEYVHILEKILIDTLKNFNMNAKTCENMEGVFIEKDNTLQKIGFTGVHINKYCTMHGISVNIENDILRIFNLIKPCGYENLKVTSVEEILKNKISYDLFIDCFIQNFLKQFNFKSIKRIEKKDKNKCK
ncbi:MAG: lipoyl(octanoyl) transferase LipB [Bdellovibrionota bacterium]